MSFAPKPEWLKIRPPAGPAFNRLHSAFRSHTLHTVCEEALCPNIAECWGSGTATLLLLGDVCTRGCRFCAVETGRPNLPPDPAETEKAAETVESMKLRYVVLTSVDRDDLPDGGAGHFARTIRSIRKRCPGVGIEALIPDFRGDPAALLIVAEAAPDVLGHNIETVRRLTPTVRDARATYDQSLEVLRRAKEGHGNLFTKSSILLGLGETDAELLQAFADLRNAGVDFLTLGQYLQPTKKHLSVESFVHPEKFSELRETALSLGFRYVASGPLVRSSYKAGEFFRERS